MLITNEEVQRCQAALDDKTLNQKTENVKIISVAYHIAFIKGKTIANVRQIFNFKTLFNNYNLKKKAVIFFSHQTIM
jgi:hypothetical protein